MGAGNPLAIRRSTSFPAAAIAPRGLEMIDKGVAGYAILTASTIVLLQYLRRRMTKQQLVHPPSPTSLPLVGNLFSIPSGLEHLAFMVLGKRLKSDIIYLKVFGYRIVVLNSARAASDLLDKRSSLYSDRLCPLMFKEVLLDWARSPGMLGYNDVWRHHRRMMSNWLNPRSVTRFHNLQEQQTRSLLRRLLDESEGLQPFEKVKDQLFFAMASSMFQLAYGYRIQSSHDPFFTAIREAASNGTKAVMLTNFYVNLLPILYYVPDWFPGTGWKQTIREWKVQKIRAMNAPFEWTKAQVAAGTSEPSIIGDLLQGHGLISGLGFEERDDRLKEMGLAVYIGGTDTSASVLINFIAAMVLNPHIQEKAQLEIDSTLGPAAFPVIADRERLPYINNLIKELFRWRPVFPTAIPHVCFENDEYRGYHIEKGTIVMGNIWAIARDEETYPDSEAFNPDRYLDPDVPPVPTFGWGRRKCPGLHFGEASVFIAVASLLATYTFSKKKDEYGREIEPRIESTSNALVLELNPFDFEYHPRSEKHRSLILELGM